MPGDIIASGIKILKTTPLYYYKMAVIIILSVVCLVLLAIAIFAVMRVSSIRYEAVRMNERLLMSEDSEQQLRQQLTTVSEERALLISDNAVLKEKIAQAQVELTTAKEETDKMSKRHAEELNDMRRVQQEMLEQSQANFKVLANDIMERHSANLRQQNEQRMGEILTPIKENIESFRKKVDECYNAETRERYSLQERIKELIETNNNIGKEARELANALKGNSKKQGDWGEMVLENILEQSGLRKNEEFIVQNQRDDDGRVIKDETGHYLRPDVVVKYPGKRVIVIDSKVSLTAFVDYVNSETPEEQENFGKLHVASITKHINELSQKKYQEYVGQHRLDFVMMFIPNEAAYIAAMTIDPTLWSKAYEKRVLIVSPTQLVSTLRIVKQVWNTENQARHAQEIAEKSGQMYDKFVGFVTEMERIGKGLDSVQTTYNEAMKKLSTGRGSLVKRADDLKELGIKTTKRLPESYSTSNEFVEDSK